MLQGRAPNRADDKAWTEVVAAAYHKHSTRRVWLDEGIHSDGHVCPLDVANDGVRRVVTRPTDGTVWDVLSHDKPTACVGSFLNLPGAGLVCKVGCL